MNARHEREYRIQSTRRLRIVTWHSLLALPPPSSPIKYSLLALEQLSLHLLPSLLTLFHSITYHFKFRTSHFYTSSSNLSTFTIPDRRNLLSFYFVSLSYAVMSLPPITAHLRLFSYRLGSLFRSKTPSGFCPNTCNYLLPLWRLWPTPASITTVWYPLITFLYVPSSHLPSSHAFSTA